MIPESIRQDVADAVGLSLDADNATAPEQPQRRRDPVFREKVLLAYEYRCCVCGHDLRMGEDCLPNPEFLAWHRAEVFKEPARG